MISHASLSMTVLISEEIKIVYGVLLQFNISMIRRQRCQRWAFHHGIVAFPCVAFSLASPLRLLPVIPFTKLNLLFQFIHHFHSILFTALLSHASQRRVSLGHIARKTCFLLRNSLFCARIRRNFVKQKGAPMDA